MSDIKSIVAVTGASGMIGERIVQKLKERGYGIRFLARIKNS